MKALRGCAGCLIFCVLGFLGVVWFFQWAASQPKSQPQKLDKTDRSPEKQAQRDDLIKKVLASGAVAKYETRNRTVKVWIQPAFKLLPFEDKENIASVFFARYCNLDEGGEVQYIDNLTGKRYGSYGPGFTGVKLTID